MSLEEWLKTLFIKFRNEYQNLSPLRQEEVSNVEDLTEPCQVEAFWITNNEKSFQIFIFTHDPTLDDMYVRVHGPFIKINEEDKRFGIYQTIEGIEKIESALDQRRFREGYVETFKKRFKEAFNGFEKAHNSIKPNASMLGTGKEREFLWIWRGLIQEVQVNDIISDIFKEKSKKIEHVEPSFDPFKEFKKQLEELIDGYGIFIYPPIWIGEIPPYTLKEMLKPERFNILQNFMKPIIKQGYKGKILFIESDGYIAIGEQDIDKAFKYINEILSFILLECVEVISIKKHELLPISIHLEREEIIRPVNMGKGNELYDKRMQPLSNKFRKERSVISKNQFSEILNDAEKITQDEKYSIISRILLDSLTHLRNKDYSSSFILSWTIIEHYIDFQWKMYLEDLNPKKKRLEKLKNPTYFTVDLKTEILNMKEYLNNDEYNKFMKLKKIRNDFMHKTKLVQKEKAEESFLLSRDLINKLIKETK